jgi:hypothetical protein
MFLLAYDVAGKRKDSPAADSPRDAKRPREDSEPMDEDDDDDGATDVYLCRLYYLMQALQDPGGGALEKL